MSADTKDRSRDRVPIRQLPTGVLGLDEILGGGLPEYSFNILAGAPGSGKTTLAHQIMFANATPERPAIYFAIVKEVEASNPGVVVVDSRLPRPDQRHPRAVVE